MALLTFTFYLESQEFYDRPKEFMLVEKQRLPKNEDTYPYVCVYLYILYTHIYIMHKYILSLYLYELSIYFYTLGLKVLCLNKILSHLRILNFEIKMVKALELEEGRSVSSNRT